MHFACRDGGENCVKTHGLNLKFYAQFFGKSLGNVDIPTYYLAAFKVLKRGKIGGSRNDEFTVLFDVFGTCLGHIDGGATCEKYAQRERRYDRNDCKQNHFLLHKISPYAQKVTHA